MPSSPLNVTASTFAAALRPTMSLPPPALTMTRTAPLAGTVSVVPGLVVSQSVAEWNGGAVWPWERLPPDSVIDI